jgi:hypothetical protein
VELGGVNRGKKVECGEKKEKEREIERQWF